MPRPRPFNIVTPRGEFLNARAAAQAHECSAQDILHSLESDPDNYQKKLRPIVSRPSRTHTRPARGTWPLSWSEYRMLELDHKEQIYLDWVTARGLDPEQETTAVEFFDQMDAINEAQDTEQLDTQDLVIEISEQEQYD